MCISNLTQISSTLTNQDLSTPKLTYSSKELKELQDNIKHDNIYLALNPGIISYICKYKINRTKINTLQRYKIKIKLRAVDKSNLLYIKITDFGDTNHMPNMRIAILNAITVKNKDQIILQELNNNINVALITETSVKDTQKDIGWLNQSDLHQGSYEISTHNRLGERRGGGIVLIFGRNNNINILENGNTPTIY